MNVVHISSYNFGGAAIAGRRIHDGLLSLGENSTFIFLKSKSQIKIEHSLQFQRVKLSPYEKILRNFKIKHDQKQKNDAFLKRKGGSYEIFTFPITDYRVEDSSLVASADILHLHWVSDFINYPSFFNSINKPIVWTFHDMNPMMGGFHYMNDKLRNQKNLGILEDQLVSIKRKSLSKVRSLSVVTPSKWLFDYVDTCDFFKHYPRFHIPYGLDLSVFKPIDKTVARSVFNLPLEKRIVLFVSERLNNFRKGFDLLQDAVAKLNGDDYLLVAIGANNKDGLGGLNNVVMLGPIADERLMSVLYSAADLFILPSREDNFPNVMLESLACGTPVMAFGVGGMVDVVVDGVTGIRINEVSSKALQTALEKFFEGSVFDPKIIRNFAVTNFDSSIQAVRYKQLYRSVLYNEKCD